MNRHFDLYIADVEVFIRPLMGLSIVAFYDDAPGFGVIVGCFGLAVQWK